jgi:nucleotide-binding universal stress UspA family protein
MNILLAVDGSAYTKRMLAYVAAQDEWFGPRHRYAVLTVVTAITPHVSRFLSREQCETYYDEEAEAVLGPVRKFIAQQGWQADVAHIAGHAADAIAEFAQAQKIDLIVMGSHGHTSLVNMVLGSVASGVLARCKVPVMLVR